MRERRGEAVSTWGYWGHLALRGAELGARGQDRGSAALGWRAGLRAEAAEAEA